MKTREFQAETKQLLDLMIHSIYTHREIFLRELISNASDALDKVKFKSLTEPELLEGSGDFEISIEIDEENNTLTISDNGIGMTSDEVIENIGTIAKSGSKQFFEKLMKNKDSKDNMELIGQFGVGFYSSFMVADKVVLTTKTAGAENAVIWESTGDGTYKIGETDKEKRGTEITLHMRDIEEDKEEKNFVDQFVIESLVKKYSDYIRYPVNMDFHTENPEEKDEDGKVTKEKEVVVENRVMNSMTPLWQKTRTEIEDEDYNNFYKQTFHAWDEPVDVIHTKGEGTIEYTALLFIPEKAPYEFYSTQYERGLKLYSKQIFIMEKCKELLPEYLGFVKGIVDSPDFSLNISREILQHNRQLRTISKKIESKVLDSLKYMLGSNREKYEKFWTEFGRAIKAGVYAEFGTNKEKLQDLLLFYSSASEKMTTLKEYVERMPETQKEIYYAAGNDRVSIERMPQMEVFRDKGVEVLYLIDKIDEFTSVTLREYDGKTLKSISLGDIDLSNEEEKKKDKEEKDKLETENKDLLKLIKDNLENRVADVHFSSRLKSSAVCLVGSNDGISLHMEQLLAEAGQNDMMSPKASKILEINPDHKIFNVLQSIFNTEPDSEKLKNYSVLLYNQALMMEGMPVDNPIEFANQISTLMIDAEKI